MSERRLTKQVFALWNVITIVFLCLCFILNGEFALASFILYLSLWCVLLFVYDVNKPLYGVNNLFIVLFYGIGIYGRYLFTLYRPDEFMEFAPIKQSIDSNDMIMCSIIIWISVLMLAIGKHFYRRCFSHNTSGLTSDSETIQEESGFLTSPLSVTIYLLLIIVGDFYSFTHIVSATSSTYYGLSTLMSIFNKGQLIMGIAYLSIYLKSKKTRYLLLFLLYLIPTAAISIISGWKNVVIYLIIFTMMTIAMNGIRVKKTLIFSVIIAIILIYPINDMIRSSVELSGNVFSSNVIRNYYSQKSTSLVETLSNRFSYFDEICYVVAMPKMRIDSYLSEAGHITTRFFSGLIPRALWKTKPTISTGAAVTYTLLGYRTTTYNNLSISLLGDAYTDSGIWGIIFYLFILGILLEKVERLCDSPKLLDQGLYIAMSYSIFQAMEGDIASKALGAVIYYLVYLILNVLIRRCRVMRE